MTTAYNTFGLSLSAHEDVRRALSTIELEVVPMVGQKTKWKRWRYDELARLAGDEDDWRNHGKIRSALVGGDARSWMRKTFRLWWTGDNEYHIGLLFTADCMTGMEWDRLRIHDRVLRDGSYLEDAAKAAAEIQPMFRGYFRNIERAARRVVKGAESLGPI